MFESLPLNRTRHRETLPTQHVVTLIFERHLIVWSSDGKKRFVDIPMKRHYGVTAALPIICFSLLWGLLSVWGSTQVYTSLTATAVPLLLKPTYNEATAECMGMIRGLLDSLQQRELLNPR